MRVRWLSIHIAALVTVILGPPAMAAGQLSEYYFDWATSKEGASITSPCKTIQSLGIQRILDPVKGEDGCIFADGIEQHEEFTIDLGKERPIGQVMFVNSTASVYEEIKRVPNSLTISISTESADGPWKTVFTKDPSDVIDSFALDNVPARWLHFDLGANKDGIGSRVSKVKVFKRYLLQSGPELMKTFCNEFRRDAPGLEDYWKAVDAQDWDAACDAIIEHYSHAEPRPKGAAVDPRVKQYMENAMLDGGSIKQFESSDWDWFRQLPLAPPPSLGLGPGARTILALIANAYESTGDVAYANKFSTLLRDWLQDVPCPGVQRGQDGDLVLGWAGLNASTRATIFGQMVCDLFPEKDSILSRDMKINLLYSLWEHLSFLHQIAPELGGNWATNVNCNLFGAAVGFPEFVDQKQWLNDSKSTFETSLSKDVYASGKEVEDSMMYVTMASGQLLWQYDCIRKAGLTVSAESEDKMSRLWDCLAWMAYPNKSTPSIGDCHRDSPLGIMQKVVPDDYLKYFDRPDMVYINTRGKSGTMPAQTSRAFSDTGWYIMRTAWDTSPYDDARQMFFKCSATRGHGHQDQNEVTMYAYGREILTDPGMPSYNTPLEASATPTSAHSTICVDEKDQAHVRGKGNVWATSNHFDFVDAQCDTYSGLTHRRQIVFLKPVPGLPDYWLIHDAITGTGSHKLDLNFHFSADANPKVVLGSVVSTYPTGGNALIRMVDQSAQPEIVDSSIALVMELVPTKTLRYRKEQAAPAGFDTLVVPFKGPNAPKITAGLLKMDASCEDNNAIGIKVATNYGFDVIITSTKPGSRLSFERGRFKTNASALVIRVNKGGKMVYAFQAGGTNTDYRGKPLLTVQPGSQFTEKSAQ